MGNVIALCILLLIIPAIQVVPNLRYWLMTYHLLVLHVILTSASLHNKYLLLSAEKSYQS